MNDALVPSGVSEKEMRRLMAAYGTPLLRLCYVYLRDAHLAQDAVQETFLKVYRKYPAFRGECSEQSWIMGIAINICKDILRTPWIRRVDRSMPLEERLAGPGQDPHPDSYLLEEVLRLPPKMKDVILLRYYENMKLADISASLRVSERTVRARLGQAGRRLRQRLERWYFDEE